MPDLFDTFRQRAEDLISTINRQGGIQATIEGLRRQMAASDRRRSISKVKAELNRLDNQINELITAVGVQAVGLHQAGRLTSPELQPLCQHILELKAAVEQQKAELAKLEALSATREVSQETFCVSCGKPLPPGATFCPYCGQPAPAREVQRFCTTCGAELRPQAKFCAKCGQRVGEGV